MSVDQGHRKEADKWDSRWRLESNGKVERGDEDRARSNEQRLESTEDPRSDMVRPFYTLTHSLSHTPDHSRTEQLATC